MEREISALEENGTWVVVDSVPRPITGRWVFDIKRGKDNQILYFKARWVVHGFKQKEGVDYNETHAATAHMKTFKMLVAIAVHRGWGVYHCDISNAFTHGKLEEEIFTVFPKGFEGKEGKCLKLVKALYGLKQASRVWQQTLTKTLSSLGFMQCVSDVCLFMNSSRSLYISLHVDDLQIVTASPSAKDQLVSNLRKVFPLKDLGRMMSYLGMRLHWKDNGSCCINQADYITRMAERFGLQEAKSEKTPMAPGYIPLKADSPTTDDEKQEMAKVPYRQLIGSLLYASLGTRPDITFAVSVLSRFNNNPGAKHWKAAKRILRYLIGTKNKGLVFQQRDPKAKVPLVIFSDSDWGSNPEDRKSVAGRCVCLGGGLVTWASKRQQTTALSSCEAEFLALSEAVKEALWLRQVLKEMGVEYDDPVVIRVDNQAAIALTNNPVLHQRSKHIDIRYFRIREEVKAGRIKLVYVPTGENLADVFTKAPSLQQFSNLCKDMVEDA